MRRRDTRSTTLTDPKPPSDRQAGDGPSSVDAELSAPPMAVSIAGISTACSKDALVSSAKAVREALSTE